MPCIALSETLHACTHVYMAQMLMCTWQHIYMWSVEWQVISESLAVQFVDSRMQWSALTASGQSVIYNTLPLQLVVGVKGLLTVHTYSDCQQLPHSPGEPLKFKVERCCMNSQALQQSESDNRWSHRVGLLGLVMFNGIIHLTCVLNNLHQTCILCDTYNTQVHFIQFQPALMEVIYNFACCITLGTPNTLYTLFLHTWHLVGWMGPISIHHFCASWIHWLYKHLIKQPHMYTTPRQHYT